MFILKTITTHTWTKRFRNKIPTRLCTGRFNLATKGTQMLQLSRYWVFWGHNSNFRGKDSQGCWSENRRVCPTLRLMCSRKSLSTNSRRCLPMFLRGKSTSISHLNQPTTMTLSTMTFTYKSWRKRKSFLWKSTKRTRHPPTSITLKKRWKRSRSSLMRSWNRKD